MSSGNECPKCGAYLGSLQAHPDVDCRAQQTINDRNKGYTCKWCGSRIGDHKAFDRENRTRLRVTVARTVQFEQR